MGGKGKGPGKDKPVVQCTTFEPQAWRRNLCKNCFKTKVEHNGTGSKSDPPPPTLPKSTAKEEQKVTATAAATNATKTKEVKVTKDKTITQKTGIDKPKLKQPIVHNKKDDEKLSGIDVSGAKKKDISSKITKREETGKLKSKPTLDSSSGYKKQITSSQNSDKGVIAGNSEKKSFNQLKGPTVKETSGISKDKPYLVRDKHSTSEKEKQSKDKVGLAPSKAIKTEGVKSLSSKKNHDTEKTSTLKSEATNLLKSSPKEIGQTYKTDGRKQNVEPSSEIANLPTSSNDNIDGKALLYSNTPAVRKEHKITGDKSFTSNDDKNTLEVSSKEKAQPVVLPEQSDCQQGSIGAVGNTKIYSAKTTNPVSQKISISSSSTQNYSSPIIQQHTKEPKYNIERNIEDAASNNNLSNTDTDTDNKDRQLEQQQITVQSSTVACSGTEGVPVNSGASPDFYLPPLEAPPQGKRTRSSQDSSSKEEQEQGAFKCDIHGNKIDDVVKSNEDKTGVFITKDNYDNNGINNQEVYQQSDLTIYGNQSNLTDNDKVRNFIEGDTTDGSDYYEDDKARLLKESLTDITDVFDAPLSPNALDKYRKELFDSEGNIASPNSPAKTAKFHLGTEINTGNNGSSFEDKNVVQQQEPENQTSLFYYSPEADRYAAKNNEDKELYDYNQGQTLTIYSQGTDQDYNNTPVQSRNRKNTKGRRRRRSRDDLDEWDINEDHYNMASHERSRSGDHISREEAMMEGTRMLMDNLRDKITVLEDKNDKMDREKHALHDLLSVKKAEYVQMKDHYKDTLRDGEDTIKRLSAEKERLLDRLKLPESERSSLRDTERIISKLNKKLEEAENNYLEMMDDNMSLKQEVKDLQTEIDEMHDQFREDEQIEFRELQRELEMNAKNCRILQFKLRKSERRNDQLEIDRSSFEEKIRQLESRFEGADDKQQIRELEEELKMAKEVSVRLHDELELVEEKRARYEEELDRVNDILTDSENRKTSLQKEIDSLKSEVDSYRKGKYTSLSTPTKHSLERQSSSEYDLKQVMHDLQDSLERENDLKEQMEFRDEEIRTLKRRLTDFEQENESLDIQLQKISSAKSGKYFKKAGDNMEREIVTEREHELRLQMELAEQELKVLRRKMDEMDLLNETLIKELKRVERELHNYSTSDKDGDNGRSEEEKMRSMAEDIQRLKWNLIEKDQEADRQRRAKTKQLKKSKSLEDENSYEDSEYQIDLRRQLEAIQQEADVLRQKISHIEEENERLLDENKKLEFRVAKNKPGKPGGIPAVTTDDAAIQNIELKDRVKGLEDQNIKLRDQIKSLDDRTSKLSKEVTRSLSRSHSESYDLTESKGLRSKLKTYEEECNQLRKKVTDLESKNGKLNKELEEKKSKKAKKDAKKEKEKEREKDVVKMSKDDLRSKVALLDDENKDFRQQIKNREEENSRLEMEITEYREDMDKMFSSFRVREQELVEEMENLQNKNDVISNLLDIVTERAEYAQKELYKSVREYSRSPSSAVSDLSGVSVGSDEVFTEKILEQRLEEQFMKKIDWLERNLAEERQKVQAAERRLEMTGDHESKSEEDKKLHLKEKDILQQEVTVAQSQLKDANKKVKELRTKLDKITEEHDKLKEMEKKQLEEDGVIKKLKEDLKKKDEDEKAKTKKSSAWIWEKQAIEADLKEHKRKVEELHAEVKRQQFKWKMAGEDIEREQKLKLQMQEELEHLKKSAQNHKSELSEIKNKLQKSEENLKKQSEEWERERKSMEKLQKQSEKEIRNKEDVIKQKDEIINQKEDLISQKTTVLSERDDKIKKYDGKIQKQSDEIAEKSSNLMKKENELSDVKSNVKDLLSQVKDKDRKIKTQSEDVRKRDDRLQEKDDILQKLNRKLTDRENEIKDMDQTIRQAMKKLQDRENELKTTEKTCKEFESQLSEFRSSNKEQKEKISRLEKEKSEDFNKILTQKEKLESELSSLKKEKWALLSELQDNKEKLNIENEKLKKEKNKLELDLKQANEKLHSMKATSHMKESEVVKTLTGEKENLITDKHKLNDEINTLRKKSQQETKKWNNEREDLQKIIKEKTKMLEDNSVINEKMQKEMDKLKQQAAQGSPKLTPIPVLHQSSRISKEVSSSSGPQSEELRAKIERQDLMYQAEKLGLEELYDGKVKNLQEQLDQSQSQIGSLRVENDQQLDLIQSSRVALSDLRKRYDSGIVTWNEERDHLLKKSRTVEDKLEKLKSVEKALEDMKTKLQKEESKRREAENKLASEKNSWNAERTTLNSKKDEQTGGGRGPSSSVSEFRAKFEKFGGPTKSKTAAGKSSSEDVADAKAKDESLKVIKNLQKQIKDLEKTRESDRKELLDKVDQNDKDWKDEKKKLMERNKKLESQSSQLAEVQKTLVNLQYKYHEDQEKWSLERNRTKIELDETRKLYVEEKGQINELVAEVKKLQSITSTKGDPKDESSDKKSQTKIVIKKPFEVQRQISASSDEHITEYIQEVLRHISELVETYEKAKPLRRGGENPSAPPAFRRSLSTTEIELGLDSYIESSILRSSRYSHHYTSPSSSKSHDPPVRLRQYRRTISDASTSDYESKTVDRHMRGRNSEKRSSKYLSGTQSAYGSRDTSPDLSKSSLPKAPPSMIISPSHTPRRARSKDRQSLSKRDMAKLYEKLGKIDLEEEKQSRALVKERGHGIRVLTKSMSVDTTQDEIVVPAAADEEELELITKTPPMGKRFATIAKIHSKSYEDAPLSNTLLASIRIGELVITPGVEEITKKIRKLSKKRSDSASPSSARRSFFDNYSFSPKSYFSWPKKERSKSIEVPDTKADKYESDTDTELSLSQQTDDEGEKSTKETKKKSKFSFFKGVRDKRKLFSIKRSSSVENSPVHSTVVSAGVNTLMNPGAPSTFEAPEVPIVEPQQPATSSSRQSRKLSKLHRAASVDATVMLATKTDDKSHSSFVSSLIAQREANITKSPSSKSSSSKPMFFGRNTRAQSVEPDSTPKPTTSLFTRLGPKSISARWRSNPSFRLASEKPVVIKKDELDGPKQVLNGKLSESTSSFTETKV